MSTDQASQELHLLYVLLDSNLPTGGFVSSSGLESYAKHGFLTATSNYQSPLYPITSSNSSKLTNSIAGPSSVSQSPAKTAQAIVEFARAEVGTYALNTLCFVKDCWEAVNSIINDEELCRCNNHSEEEKIHHVVQRIEDLDNYHEANLLSHVSRRSSKAQGIAMLTLYGRGLSRPSGFEEDLLDTNHDTMDRIRVKEDRAKAVVDQYKRLVRKGSVPGHLAVCWGVITAAMGLSLDRALHLHLFLHARSLLSSAVRLNLIGPYASSQLLLHPFRGIIDQELKRVGRTSSGLKPRSCTCDSRDAYHTLKSSQEDFWSWTEEADHGPGTSWPLGEVLMARHDLQHSRIFNS